MARPPSGSRNAGPTTLGRYRLVRHLASGGMGEVYLAEAIGAAGFAKRMVVKTLRADLANDTQLAQQLIAEGRLLEALDHPNIAQILDLGQADGTIWLAMEYVDGFDLRGLLRALPSRSGRRALSPGAVLYVVACVARALEHAQTRPGPAGQPLGVVHHDVSPSNVMIRRDGHVKLVDFGVAKAALLGKMAPSALRGKLPYLSPEHASQQPVDGRADLFALGLVAYELATGERAMELTEPERLARAHQLLPARVAGLPNSAEGMANLGGLIRDLTQLDPRARPANAAAVAARAETALVQLGVASPSRQLAEELAPAFDRLTAKIGSFDQTLLGILGLADSAPSSDRTGTLSLPGLDVVAIAAASAKDEGGGLHRRFRKRWIWAGVAVVAAAVGLGFWVGQGASPPPEPAPATLTPTPPVPAPIGMGTLAQQSAAVVAGLGPQGVSIPVAPSPVAAAHVASPTEAVAEATRTAGVADSDAKAQRQKPREKSERTATLRFRVRPFGCRVTVDGERRLPVANTDRYEVRVAPGDHRVIVEDTTNGLRKAVEVSDVGDGEVRTIDRGICLGADCPEGP